MLGSSGPAASVEELEGEGYGGIVALAHVSPQFRACLDVMLKVPSVI